MKKFFKTNIFILLCTIMASMINISANAEPPEPSIEKIDVTFDYIPKNGSDDHNLVWGSSIGIYAKVLLSDGTYATDDNKEVDWEIEEKSGAPIQSVWDEYTTSEGFSGLDIYAPYGYEQELIIKAISKKDNSVFGKYELAISSKSVINPNIFKVCSTFYDFSPNEPEGKKSTGNAPEFTENWDRDNRTYSITLPENTYKINGYDFQGWTDDTTGKLYQPGETLTIKFTGSPLFCKINAMWKLSTSETTTATEPVTTNDNSETIISPRETQAQNYTEPAKETQTYTESPKTKDTNTATAPLLIVLSAITIIISLKLTKSNT